MADEPLRLSSIVDAAIPFALPLRREFRRVVVREGVLIHGPSGWGEFAPFDDYDDVAAGRWLLSAIEAAYGHWPTPVRERIQVNAIVPAVGPAEAAHLTRTAVRDHGCRTVKVKVGGGADLSAGTDVDEARVASVRDALDAELGTGVGRLRIDVNAAWTAAEAVAALTRLAAYGLEYVEQPCATAPDLLAVRRRVDVPIAADESIRTAADPASVAVHEFADIAICKAAPLGGVAAVLRFAESARVPIVVSGSLDSSVGLAAGLAAAGALADLPYACGFGTGSLLAADVVLEPLEPVDGYLTVVRPTPDPAALARAHERLDRDRAHQWFQRLERAWLAAGPAVERPWAGPYAHGRVDA